MSGDNGQPVGRLRALRALVGMELRLAARRSENVLVTILIPAVVLVFFATVDLAPQADRPLVVFLLPGTVALAIIAASFVNLSIATAYERSYGVLKRLAGAPVERATILAAKVAAVAVIEAGQLALLVGIAWLGLGWRPEEPVNIALVAIGMAVGTVAFAGMGLALAGRLRAEATLAIANGLFLAFLLLGGVVLPVDHLPGILADIGAALPAGALSAVLRAGLGAGGEAIGPLLVLAAWAVAGAAAAVRFFRWE